MRIKTGTVRHQAHKKIFSLAKGYRMSRHKLLKASKDAVLHAGEYAFAGRKKRKRDFRRLWIVRINAGLTNLELSYSHFINALKKANVELDRKILSDLATSDFPTFEAIVKKVK